MSGIIVGSGIQQEQNQRHAWWSRCHRQQGRRKVLGSVRIGLLENKQAGSMSVTGSGKASWSRHLREGRQAAWWILGMSLRVKGVAGAVTLQWECVGGLRGRAGSQGDWSQV